MLNVNGLPRWTAVGAAVALALPASAGYTVYSDRAAFEAAVAGTLTHENFNAITADRSFQTDAGAKTVGPLTFAETGPYSAGTINGEPNRIDATPFEVGSLFTEDDTTFVYLAASADDNPDFVYGVDLTFSEAATAFGADFTRFIGANPGEEFRLTLLSATTAGSFDLPTLAASGTYFFGIIADPGDTFGGIAFSAIEPIPGRRATVGMDNVAVALIPEPATGLLLCGLAFTGALGGRRRSCRAAR